MKGKMAALLPMMDRKFHGSLAVKDIHEFGGREFIYDEAKI